MVFLPTQRRHGPPSVPGAPRLQRTVVHYVSMASALGSTVLSSDLRLHGFTAGPWDAYGSHGTVGPYAATHGPRVHGALLSACTDAVPPMVPTGHGDPGGTSHDPDPGCPADGGLVLASPRYRGPTVPAAPWVPALPPTDRGSTAFFSHLLRLVPPANPTDHVGPGGTAHGPNPRCTTDGGTFTALPRCHGPIVS